MVYFAAHLEQQDAGGGVRACQDANRTSRAIEAGWCCAQRLAFIAVTLCSMHWANSSLSALLSLLCCRGSSKGQQASYAKFPAPVSHKHARAARMLDSPQHKKGQSKRSKAGSPARSASPRTSSDACACPALAASPKPENLPMPTTGLLSRALVRSRSPSPPKDAAVASLLACYQVQQLVRPVAA